MRLAGRYLPRRQVIALVKNGQLQARTLDGQPLDWQDLTPADPGDEAGLQRSRQIAQETRRHWIELEAHRLTQQRCPERAK